MQYAVKLLTSSDLTLFEAYYREHTSSKQKGVNLNGDVLAGRLYPTLPSAVTGTFEQPITLDIYGPSGAPLLRVRRKIIKPEGGKNWRLNGKLIEAPSTDPDRYNALEVGDLAVFGFDGDPLPSLVSMVVLSAGSPTDGPLVDYIRATFALAQRTRSMVALSTSDLAAVPAPAGHPLRLLLPDPPRTADLIAAADDDEEARQRLDGRARSGITRPVSAAELAAAKLRAQEVGRAGEVLFCEHLERECDAGRVAAFEWTADQNATSPFDFAVTYPGGSEVLIDVKSTTGPFEGVIHISAGELDAAEVAENYRIARVFDLDSEAGPKMCMSDSIQVLAAGLRSHLALLPPGVRATKLEIRTDVLTWEAPQELRAEED